MRNKDRVRYVRNALGAVGYVKARGHHQDVELRVGHRYMLMSPRGYDYVTGEYMFTEGDMAYFGGLVGSSSLILRLTPDVRGYYPFVAAELLESAKFAEVTF